MSAKEAIFSKTGPSSQPDFSEVRRFRKYVRYEGLFRTVRFRDPSHFSGIYRCCRPALEHEGIALNPSAIPAQPRLLYLLSTHDGAQWLLHTSRRVDRLLGRDVCIEGTRSDFATIDMERIWAVGGPRPMFWRERLWLLIE
ncbi:MAG: hypothetical protein IPG62_10930 [Sphingomonadales bacterium]|nr:hypothetical protein [Sphingomonadales bacterium]